MVDMYIIYKDAYGTPPPLLDVTLQATNLHLHQSPHRSRPSSNQGTPLGHSAATVGVQSFSHSWFSCVVYCYVCCLQGAHESEILTVVRVGGEPVGREAVTAGRGNVVMSVA